MEILSEKQDGKEFLKTWRKPWRSKKSNQKWSVRMYLQTQNFTFGKNFRCRKGKGAWKASRGGILRRTWASNWQCRKEILPNCRRKEKGERINLFWIKRSVKSLNHYLLIGQCQCINLSSSRNLFVYIAGTIENSYKVLNHWGICIRCRLLQKSNFQLLPKWIFLVFSFWPCHVGERTREIFQLFIELRVFKII